MKAGFLWLASFVCVAILLNGRVALAQQVENATADAAAYAYTHSAAWPACGNGDTTLDGLIKAIPCVAKTDLKSAQALLDYLNSFKGTEQRMALARQLSRGDGMREAELEGTWDGELRNSTILVAEMQQKQILPTIVNYPHAPVRLTNCTERHDLSDPQWDIAATWVSVNVPLTAVKIRIETQDAFGTVLQTDDLSPTGDFQASVATSDSWTVGDLHMPPQANVSKVRCSIIAAAFADGKVWNAPKPRSKGKP